MPNETDPAKSTVRDDGLPILEPDIIADEFRDQFDDIVPSFGYHETPMVGIGGSAGSFAAMKAFFEATPLDSGLVFVVILHLAPDHVSMLPEMIQKWTKMPVIQAETGVHAKANHVYVIPPGKRLVATDGHLRLTPLDREPGRRLAVDMFFRSLADSHGPHAAAVVLSGADGDGSLGIKRIKERGGLTIAQAPGEAEHDSMPRAAIATGMVDWVLPAQEMPARILRYIATEQRLKLPSEEGPQPATVPRAAGDEPETALRDILVFLRTRTGRDFSYYKRATILRRISRRMQVNNVEDMGTYLEFLRNHPGEAGALLKDLLISVTNFFRDRESFEALEARLPELFAGKIHGDTVRVWVPACATGEEAYSLAIMLIEYARNLDVPPVIQVFGCDLDEEAIQFARAGIFPEGISADVNEDRLRRFFIKEHRGYRIRREVREVVLFATHDLLKDAPFSRLDLITCRNLLIYLNRDAQGRAFDIFNFALKPEGLLFLGSSESVEDGNPLFRILDKKHRIYTRKQAARIGLPVPIGPSTLLVRQIEHQVAIEQRRSVGGSENLPPAGFSHGASLALTSPLPLVPDEDRMSWGELHFKLIERFSPPSILVDADHDIQHLSQSAGRFLQVIGGRLTTNLLRLVHPALRIDLRTALFRAAQTGNPAEANDVLMDLDGERRSVNIRVSPASDLAPDFLLVVFDAHDPVISAAGAVPVLSQPEPVVQHLERELEQMKNNLRDTVEQYEAGTEELKASNEELQAMNEELRSATEELETSREELQSINEELTTVNHELKSKVDEVGHAHSDLQNLMGAAAIATVFLDREMHIMRFTDSAAPIFNFISSDIGRPLSDLQHRIEYPQMADDAVRVLASLMPVEREVHGSAGACYIARILPYRTVEDRIAGVVLTFVDITERQQSEAALLQSESRYRSLFESMDEGFCILEKVETAPGEPKDFRFLVTNPAFERHTGLKNVTGHTMREMLPLEDTGAMEAVARVAETGEPARYEGRVKTLDLWVDVYVFPTESDHGRLAVIFNNVTARKQAEESLRERMEELTLFNTAAVGRETRMIELKREINELAIRLGESPRYSLDFDAPQ